MSFPFSNKEAERIPENSFFSVSLVTGGEVSRVDPESTALNPVWRNSLVYTTLGTSWEDDANLTQIEAARQLLVRDMKILEGVAPESGAYLNEVRITRPFRFVFPTFILKNTDRAIASGF